MEYIGHKRKILDVYLKHPLSFTYEIKSPIDDEVKCLSHAWMKQYDTDRWHIWLSK